MRNPSGESLFFLERSERSTNADTSSAEWNDLCPIYEALPSSALGGIVPTKVKREALEGHRRQHRPMRLTDSF